MDILKILIESGKDLYIEDLDFFETELATGDDYDQLYQVECRAKIKEIRAWLTGGTTSSAQPHQEDASKIKAPKGLIIDINEVAPGDNNPASAMKPEEIIFNAINIMREDSAYKTKFKKFVTDKPEIDTDFVDAHYSFFRPWELDAIVSVRQLGEEFLEKYFGALDHEKIARYQIFSESFFMKHYSQMDAAIVLEHGKNEWRKKENRSKQLDVFLRLKGVKI